MQACNSSELITELFCTFAKKLNNMKLSRLIVLASLLALYACSEKGDKYAFQYLTFKQDIPFTQDKEKPSCNIDLKVLRAYGTDTMFAQAFNRDISQFLFGHNTTNVQKAMVLYVDSIIKVFKQENQEQVDFALQEGYEPHGLDYEYIINTEVHYGNNKDIIGNFINMYQYSGGAHGGTFITCRNYRLKDGSVVTLDNYFKPDYEKVLIPILERKLLEYAGCNSRDELDEYGYFSNDPMFVSDNFEIRQDTIDFIYNQYDIAPYSTGITTLSVPLNEIENLIK